MGHPHLGGLMNQVSTRHELHDCDSNRSSFPFTGSISPSHGRGLPRLRGRGTLLPGAILGTRGEDTATATATQPEFVPKAL